MKTIIDSYKGWAISTGREHGLLGRYWWFDGKAPVVPVGLEGHRIAVIKNRAIARRLLKSVQGIFPKAKVLRVHIDISID